MRKRADGKFMARRISEEEKLNIVTDYKNGMSLKELECKYDRRSCTIIELLRKIGIYKNKTSRWTDNEIEVLKNYYPIEDIDDVYARIPRHTKQSIIQKASKLNLKSSSNWSDGDLEILKKYYPIVSSKEIMTMIGNRHSILSIKTKADRLGIYKFVRWTSDEENIIRLNYSKISTSEMMKLLPNRTYEAIIAKARQLGIESFRKLEDSYSEEQLDFIRDNWQTMSDSQISTVINKSSEGIRSQRVKMGFYKITRDYSKYYDLNKLLRGRTFAWKSRAIELFNGKCILTGSTDIAVHHIYSFNLICDETFKTLDDKGLLKSTNISDYTKDELDIIINIFEDVHSKYPEGVCLRKDIHDLFHNIYGRGSNNQYQFNQFITDYKDGKYSELIA